tara:strand:+ start:4005 stop:5801 length:1797 start_codon:yes stop_codon:yes gene_type:complete
MPKDQKITIPIDYTHRDFQSIRDDLMQIAERFYPDTFQDFSEASFGSLMIDAVAYVGDQLSFYLDYSVNESFLDTAFSYNNILRHGRILGYKSPGPSSAYGKVAFFVQVPAETSGLGPDTRYIPMLLKGTRLSSDNKLNFILTENVDFSDPKNPIVVSQVSDSTGAPTYFAIKAYGNVVSGMFGRISKTIGPYERFRKIKVGGSSINEIINVMDSEGNEYFEVDYLAQDIIYEEIPNDNYKNDNVPSILKPKVVSRKFVVMRERDGLYLQFGSGIESSTNIIAKPQDVALDIFGKSYVTTTTFDPTRISENTTYGIVPTNTTLNITYRTTNRGNSSVSVGSLNNVTTPLVDFENVTSLSRTSMQEVASSIEVVNEEPMSAGNTSVSNNELKRRILDTFPTQNRAVTQSDYENLCLRMPGKFGTIMRVSAQKDPDSLKRNLNLYVISTNQNGELAPATATTKNNLKTWINDYRMINDTVDILDPYIINIGLNFSIKVLSAADRTNVLNQAMASLTARYSDKMFIGEHFYISDVYTTLSKVQGVIDVRNVQIISKLGSAYSNIPFSINDNLSPDGSYLMCPKNAIFEIKFSSVDIKGKIT